MFKQYFILANDDVRQRAADAVFNAPEGFVVEIKPMNRSLDQNAKFHALCNDIERSGYQFAGKPRNASAWKVLLVSAHSVATDEKSEIVPGIEGEFVNIRESTASMSKKRGASLIEYALAFCHTNGIPTNEYDTQTKRAA